LVGPTFHRCISAGGFGARVAGQAATAGIRDFLATAKTACQRADGALAAVARLCSGSAPGRNRTSDTVQELDWTSSEIGAPWAIVDQRAPRVADWSRALELPGKAESLRVFPADLTRPLTAGIA